MPSRAQHRTRFRPVGSSPSPTSFRRHSTSAPEDVRTIPDGARPVRRPRPIYREGIRSRRRLSDQGRKRAMKGPQVTLTNGRYEFRIPNGAALVLADPPEAGWVMENPVAQEVGRPLALPIRDRRPSCDPVMPYEGR